MQMSSSLPKQTEGSLGLCAVKTAALSAAVLLTNLHVSPYEDLLSCMPGGGMR
jgi:hypothetical protein